MSPELRTAAASFGVAIGVVGFALQLFTTQGAARDIGIAITLGVAGVLLIVALVPHWRRSVKVARAFPSDRELDLLVCCYTVVPATSEDIGWIAQLEKSVYSPTDAIPEALLREWYTANPNGFFVVKSADGQRVGHLDILPLKPRTCEAFIAGDIVEREIRGDSLFSPSERSEVTCLYVESIALCVPEPLSNAAAVAAVMGNVPRIIDRLAEPANLQRIYAIAASTAGDRFMRRLGFEVLRAADRRKDAHDFFVGPWDRVSEHAKAFSRMND